VRDDRGWSSGNSDDSSGRGKNPGDAGNTGMSTTQAKLFMLEDDNGTLQPTTSPAAAQGPPPPRPPSPSVFSFPPRLMAILRNEGPRALLGGWVPRTLAISFGGAVFLGIYDFAMNFGKENKPTHEGDDAP